MNQIIGSINISDFREVAGSFQKVHLHQSDVGVIINTTGRKSFFITHTADYLMSGLQKDWKKAFSYISIRSGEQNFHNSFVFKPSSYQVRRQLR